MQEMDVDLDKEISEADLVKLIQDLCTDKKEDKAKEKEEKAKLLSLSLFFSFFFFSYPTNNIGDPWPSPASFLGAMWNI